MSAVTDSLADLRVRLLTRIAYRKGLRVEESTVRSLANLMKDAEVLAELARRQRPLGWLWGWLDRRP